MSSNMQNWQSRGEKSKIQGQFEDITSENDSFDEDEEHLDENGNQIYNEQDVELHTIRNERESQNNSRIERGLKKVGQNKNRGLEIDHIVDSYEIYGEDQPDDDSEQ